MSDMIRREDAINAVEMFFEDAFIEDAEVHDLVYKINHIPAASQWHRVEDGLPEMSEIVPGYVCSETLVLYDDETKHMDIGYVRRKPNGEVDWLWGLPFKTPTHWMPIEPPKEDE